MQGRVTPQCPTTKCNSLYYESVCCLIGVLQWITELGRVDITMETSAMDSMMAMPGEGHLEQLFHMFTYLGIKHNISMVFDTTETEFDNSHFVREYWSASAYGECKEDLPPNAPQSKIIGFTMIVFVDSGHDGEMTTRRSRTGFIIFINLASIYWFSNCQTSVEKSSFGSEFIMMKQCCKHVR